MNYITIFAINYTHIRTIIFINRYTDTGWIPKTGQCYNSVTCQPILMGEASYSIVLTLL